MKKTFVVILFLLIMPGAFAQVLISEVLYDPETSETDTEYVELFNQGDSAIDIGGWRINTSSIQAVIPIGTIINANSYFLIADEDDNGVWPINWAIPDYSEEEITLPNSDSGVQLLDSDSNIIDVVGWGGAPTRLFEGESHAGSDSGESLTRIKSNNTYLDTNNNSHDFIASIPNPRNSNQREEVSTEIALYATVTGSAPIIEAYGVLPDESDEQGIQIFPSPGKNKEIIINVVLTDSQGYDDIASATINYDFGIKELVFESQINSTSSNYVGKFNMSFFYDPKNYSVELLILDYSGLSTNEIFIFEYKELAAFEIDTENIFFEGNAGTYSEVLGDADMDTHTNPTIRNLGNIALNFNIYGTDLESEFDIITVDNIEYSFLDNDYSSGGTLSTQPALENVNFIPGQNQLKELTTRLFVPLGVSVGDYSGGLFLVGVGL